MPRTSTARTREQLIEANRAFYDSLWASAKLVTPEKFNTWSLVKSLLAKSPDRIEIAPGLRPRLPIEGTTFVDISQPALKKLHALGANTMVGSIVDLPFADATFDLVCALDIVEHLDDEHAAFREISRIAKPGATVLFSTPLHPEYWRPFDDFVGHCRRYVPDELLARLTEHHLSLEQSAAYGMQVKSNKMLDWGIWWMTNYPKRSMWVYNRFMMPIGVTLEKPLELKEGLIPTDGVEEIFMVLRKT
jgi:SAM-dependent methyltransferase